MTGSLVVVIVVPIVAAVTLASWLIAVYLADRESPKKGRGQQPPTSQQAARDTDRQGAGVPAPRGPADDQQRARAEHVTAGQAGRR